MTDEPLVPLQSEPKELWVAYAVSQGMPEDEANSLNKAALVAQFGVHTAATDAAVAEFEAKVGDATTEFEAAEEALAAQNTTPATEPTPPDAPAKPAPDATPAEPAPDAPDVPAVDTSPEAAPAEADVPPPAPVAAEPTVTVINSNSGRTVVTVTFQPDVMGTDADGNPVVLRTGEGEVDVSRDGQNIFRQPLMREATLT